MAARDHAQAVGGVSRTVAALYVETDGCYFGLPGVEPWDIGLDARRYEGPHPVVAHPPCQRWGRYWGGAPRKPHQYELGADEGCFEAALAAVRKWGGVLEHPKRTPRPGRTSVSRRRPLRGAGWRRLAD
jgi:hypothetical protein